MTPPELLLYWIEERYRVFQKKEAGLAAPWSDDPVFQNTYFCNVHRENDRVTRWVRNFYSPFVDHPLFEYNMVLARFLNRTECLEAIGYLQEHDPHGLGDYLEARARQGLKVWGNAYVITTCGALMGKVDYLLRVLSDVHSQLESLRSACRGPSCAGAAVALRGVDGIGSFLSAQVVADLKNTKGHPLQNADDWATFVQPGPGSLRGASWFHYGEPDKVSPATFNRHFQAIREYVSAHWQQMAVPQVCNQDLQNCLCEYDKYMRVRNGTGRSKRKYNGAPDNKRKAG